MAHIHGVSDTNKCFTIDPITRKINTRCHNKAINRYDHNSERFTFEMPRYIEGHDMMTCNRVELHYTNIDAKSKNEYKGLYIVDDLQLCSDDENFVTCSWLISQNATQYVGKLEFSLRFICQAGESVDYAWQTAIASVEVADSIFNTDTVLEESVPDVLTSWMDSVVNKVYGMVEEDVLQRVKESAAELMDDEAAVTSYTATAADWVAGDGEFTQIFTLEGVTAEMMVDVLVDDSAMNFVETSGSTLLYIENNQGELIAHLKNGSTENAIASDAVLKLKYYKVNNGGSVEPIFGAGVAVGANAESVLAKFTAIDDAVDSANVSNFGKSRIPGTGYMRYNEWYMFQNVDFMERYNEIVYELHQKYNNAPKNISFAGQNVTGIPDALLGKFFNGTFVYTGLFPQTVFLWEQNGTSVWIAFITAGKSSAEWKEITNNALQGYKAKDFLSSSEYYTFRADSSFLAQVKEFVLAREEEEGIRALRPCTFIVEGNTPGFPDFISQDGIEGQGVILNSCEDARQRLLVWKNTSPTCIYTNRIDVSNIDSPQFFGWTRFTSAIKYSTSDPGEGSALEDGVLCLVVEP